MLPTKFRFIWPSSFREDFLEINQSETRIVCGGHVCKRIGTKWAIYRGHDIDASYQVSVHLAKRFQRRRFKKIDIQKQELPMAAMFVNGSGQNEQSLEDLL
jgi:hypothetical protein